MELAAVRWFIIFILFVGVHSWDQDQMEVFDVVEEVNQNFYQLMNIPPVSKSIVRFFKWMYF